jgi:hypothetical protein
MKYKLYYNGEPAIEYCRNNPEYKYDQLTNFISKNLAKDPSKPVQELVNEFFTTKHKGYIKYIIKMNVNGKAVKMNLNQLCDFMKMSYDAVLKDISRSRVDVRYASMSEEDRLVMILRKHVSEEIIQSLEIGCSEIKITKKLTLNPNNQKDKI